jgi:tetratricopeptide (TPR) repeat protein
MTARKILGAVLGAFVWTGVVGAQNGAAPAEQAAPRPGAEARAALAEVASLLEDVKGTKGEERKAAFERAAQRCQELRDRHAADRPGCARLSFELGDIWRRHGSLEQAESAFARAAELDPERLGARAGLQQAHAQRRLKRFDEAVRSYRRVAAMQPESASTRDAGLWIGRCLEASGDLDAAIAAYRAVLDEPGRPADLIDTSNRLARALVNKGDLTGAEAVLQRAERTVSEATSGDAESAPRLRKTLAEMSARKALQRARDKRAGAHEDARKLEEARR